MERNTNHRWTCYGGFFKKTHQEEEYCKVDLSMPRQSLEGHIAHVDDVISYMNSIQDIEEVRYIKFAVKHK